MKLNNNIKFEVIDNRVHIDLDNSVGMKNNYKISASFFFDISIYSNEKDIKMISNEKVDYILSTPFMTWAKIMGLVINTVDEKAMTDIGTLLEPKILKNYNYIKNTNYTKLVNNGSNISSDFFSFVPDAVLYKDSKVVDILEIKTTPFYKFLWLQNEYDDFFIRRDKITNKLVIKNSQKSSKDDWIKKNEIVIPISKIRYCYQLDMYLYLLNISCGKFLIYFVENEVYDDIDNFIFKEENLYIIEHTISDTINDEIEYAKKWHNDYIKTFTSPKLTKEDIVFLEREKFSYLKNDE